MTEADVVVVGAGHNGLAAALVMAGAGLDVLVVEGADTVGGGARTKELVLPGYWHDVCSAVHPMAVASPFFRVFDLASHGVEMLQPEAAYAHPLDGGRAGIAYRDVDRTSEALGRDGAAWRSLLKPLARNIDGLVDAMMSDYRHVPRDLATFVRFGLRVLEQGTPAWNVRFRGEVAPALLTGVSTHAIAPPRGLGPSGAGVFLAALAHGVGWPLPRGGSQTIVDAMADELRRRGGRIETGHWVRRLSDLPSSRAVILDVAPTALLAMSGGRLPSTYSRWLRAFRYGGAAAKVDFALSGPVPWAADGVGDAPTVHLGGTRAEMQATESRVAAGLHNERPYVLAVQPGVVDDSRAPAGHHTLWSYAHVPNGSTLDVGDAAQAQVERFAPGFGDLVLGRNVVPAAQAAEYNPNYPGGDIAGGATTPWQMVMRPTPRWDPFSTPLPGVYLASASVPPGPSVHGMAGVHAAGRALRQRFGVRTAPLDLVRSPRP